MAQTSIVAQVNIDHFRYHLLHWIVNQQLPFTTVEDEDFKQMLSSIKQYVVQSGATIRNWVEDEYSHRRLLIRQLLAEARSRIHISFDLWTSPNGMPSGIFAHFVEKDPIACTDRHEEDEGILRRREYRRGRHTCIDRLLNSASTWSLCCRQRRLTTLRFD
jgi:hypothetical protein